MSSEVPSVVNNRFLVLSLLVLGLLSVLAYLSAMRLDNLGQQVETFEVHFFVAFLLYWLAVLMVLRHSWFPSASLTATIFAFAIIFYTITVFSHPALSLDMYRYVWDGRVQANGINPYLYSPDAPVLNHLRDDTIWPLIDRKSAVTVYPGGAQLAFVVLWQIAPDNVRWFQIATASGSLLAGLLLLPLLSATGRPRYLALIYLWNPLVVFETAHSAHIDGLVLPLLVGAWLARMKEREVLSGSLLGLAASMKLYPAMLLPALWRPPGRTRSWRASVVMPLAFAVAFAATYLPYMSLGSRMLGYLPQYLGERFNWSLARLVVLVGEQAGVRPERLVVGLMLATLGTIGLIFLLKPVDSARQAIGRCIWPMGAFTLLTQNLYPWYVLWIVPLLALFVQRGRLGLRLDAWTGWLALTGLVALSYMYFASWTPYAEYFPLYALLIVPLIFGLSRRSAGAKVGAEA